MTARAAAHIGDGARGMQVDDGKQVKERDSSPFSWAAAAAANRINFDLDPELSMKSSPEVHLSADARDLARKDARSVSPSTLVRTVGLVERRADPSRTRMH